VGSRTESSKPANAGDIKAQTKRVIVKQPAQSAFMSPAFAGLDCWADNPQLALWATDMPAGFAG
jgi:hypothetical protein